MADNRFNQVPAFAASGGFQIGQQSPAMNGVQGMTPYLPGGMPVSPMMQQQMMMASGMRYPMQGMRMGIASTPPPPYSVHTPSPGLTSVSNRPRTSLHKSREGQLSDKERFFEEQRQKLRLFGKPGTVKVDADKLIGSMFSSDVKTQQPKVKNKHSHKLQEEDDSFGDFLQGPATSSSSSHKDSQHVPVLAQQTPSGATKPEPQLEHPSEKKDLKSIMLEYSDLNAPKKAKGFHKLTLNEVQKSGHGHHKASMASFHESDHARSWKQNTQDLEGLFQLPVTAKQPATPTGTFAPDVQQHAYTPHQALTAGLPPTNTAVFSPAGSQVLLAPPAYSDVIGGVPAAVGHTPGVAGPAVSHPASGDLQHGSKRQVSLPDWCTHAEDQVPPMYKQVFEASVIDGKISTEHLYRILLLSGLPREKLAQIWSLCNTATPGQLTRNELWMVLALIALTQNNYSTNSLDILARCPVAPAPFFAQIQDSSAPATLATTPQQHQGHTNHQPSISLSMSPEAVDDAWSSSTAHLQQQPHTVQHPKLSTHKTSVPPVSAATTTRSVMPADDDDFADFQAASPAASTAPVSVGKDEDYGEFIGGGGVGSSASSLSYPVCNHVGNGSVVMGTGDLQPVQQQQETQQQPASLPLASLPVDDKYGTNVRSFFCSSDSSTGHTSPSFEDDDFTDGRDSLSQVSTSEQSENEDIRNFESYVVEYNQQKEKPSASPLHCPFPDLQQNEAVLAAKKLQTFPDLQQNEVVLAAKKLQTFPDLQQNEAVLAAKKLQTLPDLQQNEAVLAAKKLQTLPDLQQNEVVLAANKPQTSPGPPPVADATNSAQDGRISRLGFGVVSLDLGHESSRKQTNAGLNPHGGPGHVGRLPATPFKVTYPLSTGVTKRSGNHEFGDFKMATVESPAAAHALPPTDVSLIADEDKYSALRVLTFDSDLAQATLFEGQSHVSEPATKDSASSQDVGQTADVTQRDDDWADFSVVAEDTSSLAAGLGAETSLQLTRSSGSVCGGEDHSSTSTPTKHWVLDLSRGQLSLNHLNDQNLDSTEIGWNKNNMADWDGTGSERAGDSRYYPDDDLGQPGSPNNSSINQVSPSGFTVTAGLSKRSSEASSVRIDLDNMLTVDDDWGQYSQNTSSLTSDTLIATLSQNARGGGVNDTKDLPYMSGKSTANNDDWCDFSGAGSGGISAKVGATVTGTDETENGDSKGKFVTIKKQNLGTNEIMGLFKVRDDPATLSSYQLPQQQHHHHTNKIAPSQSHGSLRTSSSSHGHRRSSDFDDDLGPPPMDFGHDDDYDDHAFSRGYDLDDFMQRLPAATTYSPFGVSHTSPVYSRAGGVSKLKDNKEDSGSVHSLDLPSVRPTNPSSSDSQSVSSADLASGEMTGGGAGVVSAESKSVDSLDFKSDSGDVDTIDGGIRDGVLVSEPASNKPHQPIQPQELLATMPDFADRYNIEREAQGSDRCGYEWERCLGNCFKVISEANSLFNTIDSSSVCNEILKSSQGSQYMACVIEIYGVVCRVLTSMRVTAISTTELEHTLKNINLAWNNLTAFLVGTSILPDEASLAFTNSILKSDMDHAQHLACGLCLLSVDARPLTPAMSHPGGALSINSCKLTYAGRQYHATCANFWVNCVDQTLPSLTLPDLL